MMWRRWIPSATSRVARPAEYFAWNALNQDRGWVLWRDRTRARGTWHLMVIITKQGGFAQCEVSVTKQTNRNPRTAQCRTKTDGRQEPDAAPTCDTLCDPTPQKHPILWRSMGVYGCAIDGPVSHLPSSSSSSLVARGRSPGPLLLTGGLSASAHLLGFRRRDAVCDITPRKQLVTVSRGRSNPPRIPHVCGIEPGGIRPPTGGLSTSVRGGTTAQRTSTRPHELILDRRMHSR